MANHAKPCLADGPSVLGHRRKHCRACWRVRARARSRTPQMARYKRRHRMLRLMVRPWEPVTDYNMLTQTPDAGSSHSLPTPLRRP